MAGATGNSTERRADIRIGAFACSLRGFDDPAPVLDALLRRTAAVLAETPGAAALPGLPQGEALAALARDLAAAAGRPGVDLAPGLVATAAPGDGNEGTRWRAYRQDPTSAAHWTAALPGAGQTGAGTRPPASAAAEAARQAPARPIPDWRRYAHDSGAGGHWTERLAPASAAPQPEAASGPIPPTAAEPRTGSARGTIQDAGEPAAAPGSAEGAGHATASGVPDEPPPEPAAAMSIPYSRPTQADRTVVPAASASSGGAPAPTGATAHPEPVRPLIVSIFAPPPAESSSPPTDR